MCYETLVTRRRSNMASAVQSEHPTRQLTLNKMASFKQSKHPARQLTLRNMFSVEKTGQRARQQTSTSNDGINLRLLISLMLIVFAVHTGTCSEVPGANQTERYERQTENNRNLNHRGSLPSNESSGSHTEDKIMCNKGSYLNATKRECIPCPENTFMPHDNHTNPQCVECQVDSYNHQTMQWQNATHAPIFGCEGGYYKEGPRPSTFVCDKSECNKCTNCSTSNRYERRSCSNNSDAVCCEYEDMIVESNSSGCTRKATTPSPLPANSTRAEESLVCDRNYYADKSNNTCQPCPPNTYVDKDNHTSHFCFNCSEVTEEVKPEGCPSPEKPFWIPVVIVLLIIVIIIILVSFCLYKKVSCIREQINACCRITNSPEGNGTTDVETPFIQNDNGSMVTKL